MKLSVVIDRGKKRDFVDLFFLAQRGFSLDDALRWYDQKYHTSENSLFSLLGALNHFDEAGTTDMPETLTPPSWEEVKTFLPPSRCGWQKNTSEKGACEAQRAYTRRCRRRKCQEEKTHGRQELIIIGGAQVWPA